MALPSVAAGQPIRATHITAFTRWVTGVTKDQSGSFTTTHATEYALTLTNEQTSAGNVLKLVSGASTIALFNKTGSTFSTPVTFVSSATFSSSVSLSTVASMTVTGLFAALGAATGAGGLSVYGGTGVAAGTVGIGAAGRNDNHTFTVYRKTSSAQNMVMFDWADEGTDTDSSTIYLRAIQGDVNAGVTGAKSGWSAIRPFIAAVQRYITTTSTGYSAAVVAHGTAVNYYPITSSAQGTRILELGHASQVGKSSVTGVDENVGLYLGSQCYGQLGEGQLGVQADVAITIHGIDNWKAGIVWLGPTGYPANVGYPDSHVIAGAANTAVWAATGTAGTLGTRATIGADRERPWFSVVEPGRIGILTARPAAPFHAKAPTASEVAAWTYPVITSPASMIRVDQDSTAVTPSQIIIAGLTDTSQQLLIGYNTTSDYGHLAATKGAVPQALAMQAGGGKVGIGTTSISAKLHLLPTNGTEAALLVQARTTQSAALTSWQNIGGTVVALMEAASTAVTAANLSVSGLLTVGSATAGAGLLTVAQSSDGSSGGLRVHRFTIPTTYLTPYMGGDNNAYVQTFVTGAAGSYLVIGGTTGANGLIVNAKAGLSSNLVDLQVGNTSMAVFGATGALNYIASGNFGSGNTAGTAAALGNVSTSATAGPTTAARAGWAKILINGTTYWTPLWT